MTTYSWAIKKIQCAKPGVTSAVTVTVVATATVLMPAHSDKI